MTCSRTQRRLDRISKAAAAGSLLGVAAVAVQAALLANNSSHGSSQQFADAASGGWCQLQGESWKTNPGSASTDLWATNGTSCSTGEFVAGFGATSTFKLNAGGGTVYPVAVSAHSDPNNTFLSGYYDIEYLACGTSCEQYDRYQSYYNYLGESVDPITNLVSWCHVVVNTWDCSGARGVNTWVWNKIDTLPA